jgi:adenosylcobinamide-GDP ribazoletransferase
VSGFFDAVSLLTRLRTRGGANTTRAIPWMPVVGALVGAAVGLVYAGLHAAVTPLVAASIAIAIGILITGALHEDGLADVADAFGARVTRERALEIMQDPHHGTYGIIALVVSVIARVTALAALGPWTALAALPAAHSLARAGAGATMSRLPPAAGSTLGASYKPSREATTTGLVIALAISIPLLGVWPIPAVAVAAAVAVVVGLLAKQKIGGFNGDVLGAIEQLAEIGILCVAVAARAHIPWWHA